MGANAPGVCQGCNKFCGNLLGENSGELAGLPISAVLRKPVCCVGYKMHGVAMDLCFPGFP